MIRLRERPLDITVIQCYAPTAECSEEEIEKFYQQLDQAVRQCKSQDIRLVMGDVNAKVGEGKRRNIVGSYGLDEVNDRGEMFIEWCEANMHVITNTWFKQYPRNLYIWRSAGDRYRNQIHYITINSRFRNAIKSARTYPRADCDTDHILLVCTLQLKLGKVVVKKSTSRPDLKLLWISNDVRSQFFDSVAEKYENAVTGSKDPWTAFEEIVISSTKECVLKAERIGKQKWMIEEILKKMEERRKLQKNSPEYKRLNKEIRRKCKEEKEKSLEREFEDIEDLCRKDQQMMYEKVRKVTFKNTRACTGCIKEEDETIVTDQDQIRKRWKKYNRELYADDTKEEKPVIRKDMNSRKIDKGEIKIAMSKVKRGKAVGNDQIAYEMIEARGEFGVSKITEMANYIYDSEESPRQMLESVFIPLPEKPGTTECKEHCTISLMSHVTKRVFRVLLNRMKQKLRSKLSDEQFGYQPEKGTRNAVFCLRMLAEKAIENQKDLYICFIDYVKAFDRVKHKKLMKMLEHLEVDGKDLRLLANLY